MTTGGLRALKVSEIGKKPHGSTSNIVTELRRVQLELEENNPQLDLNRELADIEFAERRDALYDERDGLISRIPGYWLLALCNCEEGLLSQEDRSALMYLQRLAVKFSCADMIFRVEFHFRENPYFEEEVLFREFTTKYFLAIPKPMTIRWKTGMDLTKVADAPPGKKSPKSFFSWFTTENYKEHNRLAQVLKEIWENPPFSNQMNGNQEQRNEDAGSTQGDENSVF